MCASTGGREKRNLDNKYRKYIFIPRSCPPRRVLKTGRPLRARAALQWPRPALERTERTEWTQEAPQLPTEASRRRGHTWLQPEREAGLERVSSESLPRARPLVTAHHPTQSQATRTLEQRDCGRRAARGCLPLKGRDPPRRGAAVVGRAEVTLSPPSPAAREKPQNLTRGWGLSCFRGCGGVASSASSPAASLCGPPSPGSDRQSPPARGAPEVPGAGACSHTSCLPTWTELTAGTHLGSPLCLGT